MHAGEGGGGGEERSSGVYSFAIVRHGHVHVSPLKQMIFLPSQKNCERARRVAPGDNNDSAIIVIENGTEKCQIDQALIQDRQRAISYYTRLSFRQCSIAAAAAVERRN